MQIIKTSHLFRTAFYIMLSANFQSHAGTLKAAKGGPIPEKGPTIERYCLKPSSPSNLSIEVKYLKGPVTDLVEKESIDSSPGKGAFLNGNASTVFARWGSKFRKFAPNVLLSETGSKDSQQPRVQHYLSSPIGKTLVASILVGPQENAYAQVDTWASSHPGYLVWEMDSNLFTKIKKVLDQKPNEGQHYLFCVGECKGKEAKSKYCARKISLNVFDCPPIAPEEIPTPKGEASTGLPTVNAQSAGSESGNLIEDTNLDICKMDSDSKEIELKEFGKKNQQID